MRALFSLIRPLVYGLDPERAHDLAIRALRMGLAGGRGPVNVRRLKTRLFGKTLLNPVGLAAGFDKNGVVWQNILRLGFGFVEIGTITPKPQPGNPRPRLFRLDSDRALVNRLGFNNKGADAVLQTLQTPRRTPGLLGINVGANKDSEDRVADYVMGAKNFAPLADFMVINVSSPNTPGLRGLQQEDQLNYLLEQVMSGLSSLPPEDHVPVALKVAPELDAAARASVVRLATAHGLAGLVISNTTAERPASLTSKKAAEEGGLSGAPLFERSTDVLRDYYVRAEGGLELIGVGGVSNSREAYAKIRAGASAVELFTAFIFKGPQIAQDICSGLIRCLDEDGFETITEAVGADHSTA